MASNRGEPPDSTRQYVYGRSIDELLLVETDGGIGNLPSSRLFYHDDAKGAVVAISDGDGRVLERYTYDAYGKVSIRGSQHGSDGVSAVGNRNFYAGRPLDPETGFYCFECDTLILTEGGLSNEIHWARGVMRRVLGMRLPTWQTTL